MITKLEDKKLSQEAMNTGKPNKTPRYSKNKITKLNQVATVIKDSIQEIANKEVRTNADMRTLAMLTRALNQTMETQEARKQMNSLLRQQSSSKH